VEAELGAILGEGPAVVISGLAVDSRRVVPGDAFLALPGHHEHGARFAEEAVRAGAVAVVTDETGRELCAELDVPVVAVGNPRTHVGEWCRNLYKTDELDMVLVGITGTNGKTTVAHLVEAACAAGGKTAGLIGTLGVRYPGFEHPGVRTTPEAPDVHRALREMHSASVQVAILEVTSHAIAEHRIDGLRFDVAAFTNLSRDHLDYHGTMERYFATKAQLFTAAHSDFAIIGIDDDWGRELAAAVAIPHQTWSTKSSDANWFGSAQSGGITVRGPDGHIEHLQLRLPGGINVANATCATAILAHIGVDRMPSAFADVRVPGRMEMFQSRDGVHVIVDYAHTPAAISEVVHTTKGAGRTIVVFGAGGDRDREKRPEMGAAATAADVIIVTDDNPRSEDPEAIREQIVRGCASSDRPVQQIADRRAAVQFAISLAQPGDTVLVLGKGHEQGQEIAGVISPFDDREVVVSALHMRDAR